MLPRGHAEPPEALGRRPLDAEQLGQLARYVLDPEALAEHGGEYQTLGQPSAARHLTQRCRM